METEPTKKVETQYKMGADDIALIVIIVAVGMMIAGAYLIVSEIHGAKSSCEEREMEYKFEFPYEHLCNSKPFFKYSDGTWDWEKEFNLEPNYNFLP